MPGARLDKFLASTAVALLLAASGGRGSYADPISAPTGEAAISTPNHTDAVPATVPEAGTASTKANDPSDTTVMPGPATSANPAATPAEAAKTTDTTDTTDTKATDAKTPDAKASDTKAPDTTTPAASVSPSAITNPTASIEAPAALSPADSGTPAPAPDTASPAAAAPNPVSDTDAAIATQLRELASGKYDHIIGGKKERTTIDAFYSGRNYAPLWLTDGKPNDRAKAAITYLAHVDADGLQSSDYPVPDFAAVSDPEGLAEADLKFSMSVITYAHHAQIGRVHWSRVSADISYNEKPPEPVDVLAKMADATDVAAALDSYEPHTAGYLALKAKLAEIRAGKLAATKAPIARGPVLKVGMQDERVPQLRERLGLTGTGTTYDKAMAEAIKKVQQDHDIKATGTLNVATLEALNGRQPDRPADIIIANMERWRWMPHDLGKTYVIVNLPDYSLRVMHNDKQVWMTRIVIGKPAMPTPIMTAEMKYITVNPTWNVPPSIVNREYLPALQQDPTVLERMGLKVGRNPDGTVHIWQPPGDKNALGRIRFNFPNKFLVYQHDTPDKYLFAYDKRAYSHGCMRVQNPLKYAEVLLSLVRPADGYTEERLHRMYGDGEVDIQFPTFVPVDLTYQTAFVDNEGKLEFRDDIYGRDKALLALLKGEDRRVADIPVEHREDITHRQVMAIPDQPSLWGGRSTYSGPGSNYSGANDGQSFFSRLFGPFSNPQPAPPPRRAVRHSRVTRSGTVVDR